MTKSNDAAFASVAISRHGAVFCNEGLTKREYIATAIMQGYCTTEGSGAHLAANAELAVKQADALIEALNKE